MAKVNPPPFLKTPALFLKEKGTRKYFQSIEFILFQLYKRSGGGTDLIDEIAIDNRFFMSVKDTDYTAIAGDFIDMRDGITLTLDPNASPNDQIKTRNGDGSLIKVTSTIEIRHKRNRGNTFNFRNEGTSIHWYLFENDDATEKFWASS